MFWNKKKKDKSGEENTPKMGMLQRLAMNPVPQLGSKTRLSNKKGFMKMGLWYGVKRVMNMDPKEREKLMQKALAPENIAKNKDKILETMEQMKASGQLTDEQMKMAKEKLGL